MTFIITLVALLMERFFHWNHLRYWRWYKRYQQWISQKFNNLSPTFLLIACVTPLVLLVGLVSFLLSGWLYYIIRMVFDLVVLMYCLGPNNFWVEAYAGNSELKARALFIAAHERIFAVIFWYLLLGPLGAVLYRTIALFGLDTDKAAIGNKYRSLLDWLPVRLFTLLFALGGHFTKVFHYWKLKAPLGPDANDDILGDCGMAALDAPETVPVPEDGSVEKEAVALLDRVFVIWLVILAVVVLLI